MRRTRHMTRSGLLAAVMAVCAWIAVNLPPFSFTLQTFALLLTLGLLGSKWGSVSIALYLLLGAVGLPVFTGFRGGFATLLGPTGGFLWGFLLSGAVYGWAQRLGTAPAMAAALATCYLCGCLWYTVYAPDTSPAAAFCLCVLPYLPFDCIKLALACSLTGRIRRQLPGITS